MNFVARQDRVLLGGLAVALMVLFARPIRHLLDVARDVERSSGGVGHAQDAEKCRGRIAQGFSPAMWQP